LMGDGGDELVLEVVELGAVGELKSVLVVLFTRLGELIRELAVGALSPQKGNQQNARKDEEREITK
ncbi:MAG: hypothetical protein ACRD3K_02210, partial [Edaphobacter sp.]